MRRVGILLLLFFTPAFADADEGEAPSPARARVVAAATVALRAEAIPLAARAAWHAGRLGLHEVEPLLTDCLVRQAHLPEEDRSWALVQVLLDALARLETAPPSGALLPHLGTHQEAVVQLLARSREVYADELLRLHDEFSGQRQNLLWYVVGGALARAHPRRFMPVVLDELRIEHEVVVSDPPRRGASSAVPPPEVDRWTETHVVPKGFPPVAVVLFSSRGASGRWSGLPSGYVERTERTGDEVRIERTTANNVGRNAARLDWLDHMIARAGARNVPTLSASREWHLHYAGPTPFRKWVLPHRERLLRGWWARVEGLVAAGFVTRGRAEVLARSVDIRIRDHRVSRQSSLLPLPRTRAENPFPVKKRVDPHAI